MSPASPLPSLWNHTAGERSPRRAALTGDATFDVTIVGGGMTGLWTARYLADAEPELKIAILEAEHCGFGASGRNGGWCSALLPDGNNSPAMAAVMRDTVDEVGRASAADDIACEYAKGGTITLATNPAHVGRLRDHLGETDQWLEPDAARSHLAAAGVLGGAFTPDCAAIHPAKLSHGLADAVAARGVRIHEGTRVSSIEPGRVTLEGGGVVRSPRIVRATEAWTATLPGARRDVIPIYSLMIATEPLSDGVWDEIGLTDRQTFADGRTLIIYGQRTADGRIAFGGRGAPYHFGSRIDARFDADADVFGELEHVLRSLLPQIGAARITHRWGGPLAVPRDFTASVAFDESTGLARAGGYVGDGVATTNLAGRTLTDLLLGRSTALTALPWIDHESRRWEPEPLRWAGVNTGRFLAASNDRYEAHHQRESRLRRRALELFTG